MRKHYSFYTYITTNPNRGVLYIGVTNNLARRLVEHYANKGKKKTFAGRYYAYNLIYCEHFKYVNTAIAREKELKSWSRSRKEQLIATKNPDWKFFNAKFCGEWPPIGQWANYLKAFQERQAAKNGGISANPAPDSRITIYTDSINPNTSEKTALVPKVSLNNTTTLLSKLDTFETNLLQQSNLKQRDQYLITISVLAALGHHEQLALTLSSLPDNLLSPAEIEDALLQTSLYAGVPVIKKALKKVHSFFEQNKGVK